LIVIDFDIFRL